MVMELGAPTAPIAAFHDVLAKPFSTAGIYIRERQHASAIDIGCRNALALQLLYHDYGIERLVGVDTQPEADIVAWVKENNPTELPGALDMYDVYTAQLNTTEAEVHREKLTRPRFQQHFKFHLGPVEGHVHHVQGNFGLVILSNVLHYLESEEECISLLQAVRNLRAAEGDVFIRVKEFLSEGRPRRRFSFDRYQSLIATIFDLSNLHVLPARNDKRNEGRALIVSSIPL